MVKENGASGVVDELRHLWRRCDSRTVLAQPLERLPVPWRSVRTDGGDDARRDIRRTHGTSCRMVERTPTTPTRRLATWGQFETTISTGLRRRASVRGFRPQPSEGRDELDAAPLLRPRRADHGPGRSAPSPEPRGVTDFELLSGQRAVAVVRLERSGDVLPLRVPQRTHVIWWENVRWGGAGPKRPVNAAGRPCITRAPPDACTANGIFSKCPSASSLTAPQWQGKR